MSDITLSLEPSFTELTLAAEQTSPPPTRVLSVQPAIYPRDDFFYYDYRMFLVEGVLFQVPLGIFASESEHFRNMMELPQEPSSTEGLSDENPIRIYYVAKEDFRQLLKVLSPPQRYMEPVSHLSFSEWTSVLRLTHMWDMDQVKNHAISTMNQLPDVDPVDKIVIARRFSIQSWLAPCFNAILQRPKSFTKDDLERLGSSTFFALLEMRDRLQPSYYNSGFGVTQTMWTLGSGPRSYTNFDFTPVVHKELPDLQDITAAASPTPSGLKIKKRRNNPGY